MSGTENGFEMSNTTLACFEKMSEIEKKGFYYSLDELVNEKIPKVESELASGDLVKAAMCAAGSLRDIAHREFIHKAGFVDFQNKVATLIYRMIFDAIKFCSSHNDSRLNMLITHDLAKIGVGMGAPEDLRSLADESYKTYRLIREKNQTFHSFEEFDDAGLIKTEVTSFLEKISDNEIFKMDVLDELKKVKGQMEEILRVLPPPEKPNTKSTWL